MRFFCSITCFLLFVVLYADNAPVVVKIGVSDPLCAKSACECITQNAKRAYDGMQKYVHEKSGVDMQFSYYEDAALLGRDINEGKLDGMICKAWTGMLLAGKSGRKFERIADILKPDSDKQLTGVFIVLKDSPIRRLDDINGKVLALGRNNDYEKYYLAFETLKRHNIKIDDKSPQLFSCKEAALAVLEKRADVAVISNYALDFGCIVIIGDPKDFRIVAETDEQIPFTSFFLENKVDTGTSEKLKNALLSISGSNVPADLFSRGWIAPLKWVPPELDKNIKK